MLSQLPSLWLPKLLILLTFLCSKFINKLSLKSEQDCPETWHLLCTLSKGAKQKRRESAHAQDPYLSRWFIPEVQVSYIPCSWIMDFILPRSVFPSAEGWAWGESRDSFLMPKISYMRPSPPSQIVSCNLKATTYKSMVCQKSVILGTCFSHQVALRAIPWCCNNY